MTHPFNDQVRNVFTFSDGETEVKVQHYHDGDVMLKQGENLVFVPVKLVRAVAQLMTDG